MYFKIFLKLLITRKLDSALDKSSSEQDLYPTHIVRKICSPTPTVVEPGLTVDWQARKQNAGGFLNY